jgi:predicted small secreted protein
MSRIRTTLLLAAAGMAAAACATIRGSGVDAEDATLPEPLSRIPIYWMGTLPDCGMTAKAPVSAVSRAALRELAFERGGDAVVDARMTSRSMERVVASRGRSALPAVTYVYSGMAVKLAAKCRP